MRKEAVFFIFLLFLFLGQGIVSANELCLTYDVKTREIDDQKGREEKAKESQSRITVALGKDYFYISDSSGKTAYDFEKSRIIYVDEPTKTYSDISLFFVSGFRSLEFRNRLYIREALGKTGSQAKEGLPSGESLFDMESTLAIEKPESKEAQIIESKEGDRYQYSWNQQAVAECRLSAQDLKGVQKELFDKYLVYGCHIHPRIRRLVVEKGKVPQYLKYTYRNAGKAFTVEMTLAKSAVEPRETYLVPPDYQKTYGPPGDELGSIIASVREGRSPVKRLEKADFIKAINELVAQKQYFDAVLAVMEYSLQTGEDLPQKMNEIMGAGGKDDERVRVFFQNASAKDGPSAKAAIKKLKNIDRDGLTRGHVIDIMIANDKLMTGDPESARKLLIKALRANPYLAGVYKGLGDLLNSLLDPVIAWQCWDTARFLYPGHQSMKQINEYEKWLAKNFPDFFLKEPEQKKRPWWEFSFLNPSSNGGGSE